MKKYKVFKGTLGSGKSTLLMKYFFKKYKHDIKKYKWNKYIKPYLIYDLWQFRNCKILIERKLIKNEI